MYCNIYIMIHLFILYLINLQLKNFFTSHACTLLYQLLVSKKRINFNMFNQFSSFISLIYLPAHDKCNHQKDTIKKLISPSSFSFLPNDWQNNHKSFAKLMMTWRLDISCLLKISTKITTCVIRTI